MVELWIVIAVLTLAVVALAIYAFSLNRRLLVAADKYDQQLARVRQELAAINSAAIGVGQRLISTEKKLKAAVEQHEVEGFSSANTEPYQQAASSAERGMTAQELMDRFGLSEAEANLMSLIKMQGEAASAKS